MVFFCLLSISFFTLIEQKFLAAAQLRNGPYQVGYLGLLQPISDFIKLSLKESDDVIKDNLNFIFITLPYINLTFFLVIWVIYPCYSSMFNVLGGFLFFIIVLGLVSIPLLIISWYSNCKYSLIGGLRSVSQIVSYDCVIGFIFISILFISGRCDIEGYEFISIDSIFFLLVPVLGIWLPSILAESNRTPFDFSEGESELVSGFNTEYSGFSFSGCFMGEYISILFMRVFTGYIFIIKVGLFLSVTAFIVVIFYVWVRAFLPRYRYDKLIMARWKILLPIRVLVYTFFCCF